MANQKRQAGSRIWLMAPGITAMLVMLLTAGCSDKNKVPKGILPPEKMRQVMWDMTSAGEFVTGYVLPKDSALNRTEESAKWYSRVLQFHKISREEFEKSYLYYRERPQLMSVLVDSLSRKNIDQVPDSSQQPVPLDNPPSMITDKERKAADTVRNLDSLTNRMMDSLKLRRDSLRQRAKKFKAIP